MCSGNLLHWTGESECLFTRYTGESECLPDTQVNLECLPDTQVSLSDYLIYR